MSEKPLKSYDDDPETRDWLRHRRGPRKPGVPADYIPPVVKIKLVEPKPAKPESEADQAKA